MGQPEEQYESQPEQIAPERIAVVTLGTVVVSNHDASLGQCRLSYLMEATGQDTTALLQYYVYRSFNLLERVNETTGKVIHSESGIDPRKYQGRGYLDACRSYAQHVAEAMRKRGIFRYAMENTGPQRTSDGMYRYSTLGTFCSDDKTPDEAWGRIIEDLPDDGIEIFIRTLEEKLNNIETNISTV